jgi:hypothetical protein
VRRAAAPSILDVSGEGVMHRIAFALSLALLLTTAAHADDVSPPPSMNKADWVSDLDTLYTQMHAIHPSLNHHTSAADMDAYVAAFRKTIPTADWPHYVMGMYRLLALVGDGHTTFYPQPDAGAGFDMRYPILPRPFADGVYVVAADKAYADAVGGRIVAVGGRPMADVFKTLTQYWDHENEGWVLNWLPFMLRRPGYMHGTGIAPGDIAAPLVFTIEKSGTRRDIAIAPIAAADDAKGLETTWLHARDETKIAHPTALHGKDIPFDFVYLAGKKTVYAVYSQCDDSDKETVAAFATRLFAFIDAHIVDKLIIDIRENGGGDNYKNQPLLLGMIKARNLDRPGHLFILTSRRTFSAAQNFANQAERWTQALFVGEPTGSSANLYGDAKQFELPKTHLHPMVSTLYWEDSDPKDKRVWLLPDIAAPATFADCLTGRDAALEAALAYRTDANTETRPPNTRWFRASQKADWPLRF